ncbi:MAG: winged helix-turn-helix transcriptional regulator [Patescibacteria group bacterium]|nr:winged helix-turn-helix domain-containing protein [Patescibacteria group bacterium]MDE1945820.1 winged helix-turn-helix transcriptional regulator [Patescibacteria group bacterium]
MPENNEKTNIVAVSAENGKMVKTDIDRLFAGDSYGLFVFKKTERIVRAIYLLTGLMSDREPMKEKLRGIATDMLSNALLMSERTWSEETCQKNLASALCEMSVLFDVAEQAKMISQMNHRIIAEELGKLMQFLAESSSNYSSAKIAFPKDMFAESYDYKPEAVSDILRTPAPSVSEPGATSMENISQGQTSVTDIRKKSNTEKMSVMKPTAEHKSVKDKNNRSEVIISMLSDGKRLTIKDFAKNIKGVSDKTIQRELASLVEKGILKKEGERRWSKYFLA